MDAKLAYMNCGTWSSYINIWACLIALIAGLVIGKLFERGTTGAQRESDAYERGRNSVRPIDKNWSTALHDEELDELVRINRMERKS